MVYLSDVIAAIYLIGLYVFTGTVLYLDIEHGFLKSATKVLLAAVFWPIVVILCVAMAPVIYVLKELFSSWK